MIGKLVDGKIVYYTPRYNFLSGGNWKDGWSGTVSTGGERREYVYSKTNIDMIEGRRYVFELKNNIAKIIRRAK